MEENEIVPVEPSGVMLGAIPTKPQEVVKRASEIATELAKIVNDRKLFKVISGRKYVQVEGWNTLGAMLGVLPVENRVARIDNGWEAYVDLIRTSDGMKVGGSSAICTVEERNWSNRDEYAVRSMAITRATGKAFRLGFSWIMQLAGYEVTPAEEMPHDVIDAEVQVEHPVTPSPVRVKQDVGLQVTPKWVVENGFARTAKDDAGKIAEASWILNNLGLIGKPVEIAKVKLTKYWEYRDSGLESKDAAAKVIGG